MNYIKNGIKVEWVDLDEGLSGEYNPNDPEDIALLRFDVSELVDGEWEIMDNGSYCTAMPVHTPKVVLEQGLHKIYDEVYDVLAGGGSIKKTCESLSWMSPDWFQTAQI